MISFKDWARMTYKDKFKRYSLLFLIIAGLFLLVAHFKPSHYSGEGEVVFFYHPNCPHCKEQKPFNDELKKQFPELKWVEYDVTKPGTREVMITYAEKFDIPPSRLGVPFTVFGDAYFLGFDTIETSGTFIEQAMQDNIEGIEVEGGHQAPISQVDEVVDLPFFGEINVLDYSLPVLAILLGIVDGFNPCAMWVLVYLISLILSVKERRKIWLLVGTFVAASGILYFLFMTAWLNVFLLLGYMRPLTIIIGLGAIYIGATSIQQFIKTRGALVCDVGDPTSKKRTMHKMEKLVLAPITMGSVMGIIGLAFIVNSIEFACSAALPAIFTHVLAVSSLLWWQHYAYILLYVLFFMLDDLIIFGLAAFAVNTTVGDKYATWCKLIGGIILLGLGIVLAFFPGFLG